jgi:hypothetical protein
MVFRFTIHPIWRNRVVTDPAFFWRQVRLLGLAQQARLELLDGILGDLSRATSDRLESFNELLEDDAGMVDEFEEPTYLPLPVDDIINDTGD